MQARCGARIGRSGCVESPAMKLGLALGYWFAGPPAGVGEQVAAAEDLGFDSVWTAEAYGSDCFTPLAWLGASTTTLRLGTAVRQLSARTPTATAMPRLTLDHLCERPLHPRPRRVGPAGRRGLVRPAVPASRSPAPGSTSRSSAGSSPARSRSTSTASSTSCPSGRGHDGPRQAAQVDHPPAARRHPDLPRRRGPEERRAGRRDRRRLAADLLLAQAPTSSTATAWTRASPGPAPAARATTSRSRPGPDRRRRRRRGGGRRRAPDASASTSVAWARARSTSTPTCSPAWATRREVDKIQDLFLEDTRRPSPRSRCRWSRTSRSSARRQGPRRARGVEGDVHHHDARQRPDQVPRAGHQLVRG